MRSQIFFFKLNIYNLGADLAFLTPEIEVSLSLPLVQTPTPEGERGGKCVEDEH